MLRVSRAGIAITAAIADGAPVAFCYAGAETESVWGAVESNVASARLAGKLGFVPVDRSYVFTVPAGGPAPP